MKAEEVLKKIKFVLSFGNDAQAERLIEQYGFDKEEIAFGKGYNLGAKEASDEILSSI